MGERGSRVRQARWVLLGPGCGRRDDGGGGWGLLVLIRVEVLEVDVVFEAGFEAGEEVGPA